MQALMLRLDALVRRRRLVVLAAWLVAVAVAVPFAMRQSDNLTGGGYEVPGSQSQRVEASIAHDFDVGSRATLAAVVVPARGASPSDVRAAIGEVDRAAARTADVTLAPAAERAALTQLTRDGVRPLIVPLTVDVTESDAPDVATDLRDRLSLGDRSTQPVALHLVPDARHLAALGAQQLDGARVERALTFDDAALDVALRIRLRVTLDGVHALDDHTVLGGDDAEDPPPLPAILARCDHDVVVAADGAC